MKFLDDLTQDELKRRLAYNPETGEFHYRFATGGKPAGSRAGTFCSQGYRSIAIRKRLYKEHRLAWLYVHGRWPDGLIDHIDLQPSNNRIANLREATSQQNQFNRSPGRNKTGYKGVLVHKDGKFSAVAKIGRRYHLGMFKTAKEAGDAYREFVTKHHGEYCRVPVNPGGDNAS